MSMPPGATSSVFPASRRRARVIGAVLAIGAAGFVLTGCASTRVVHRSPLETELAGDRVALPTTALDGFLFVEARINNSAPLLLLVDTGADVLFLTPRAAEAARLRSWRGRTLEITGAVENSIATLADVARLECGGLTLRGLTAVIGDDDSLDHPERHFGRRIDGVIGLRNFADVVLELNFADRTVVVARAGTAHYSRERTIRYAGPTPVVALEIAGKRVECLIDTGSTDVISVPALEGLPLFFAPEKTDGIGTGGIGTATARYSSSQLAGEARLGPIVWRHPPISAGPKGRIGQTALAFSHLAFDQRARTIYVLDENPLVEWKRDFPANPRYKPGFFCAIEGDAIRLVEVDAGFAFHRAGLRAGDLVTHIDAMPAAEWVAAKYAGRLPPTAPRAPRFTVIRAGKTFVAAVPLAPPPAG
jgi:hypothetical protein